ncbi:MAG TPA: hypothetical protein VFG20_11845, partial [Planctomycetaceae bacterium]|nr:hypothetical protein [Planctomycetaceae bacterium]
MWLLSLISLQVVTSFGEEPAIPFRSSLQIGPSSGGGQYRYYPERWNSVHVQLTNRLDREAVLLSTAYVGDDASMQYGRAQWLPPQSTMDIAYPVWFPAPSPSQPTACDLHTQLLESDGKEELLVRDTSGKLTSSDLLQLTPDKAPTGFIGPEFDPSQAVERNAIQQLILSSRKLNLLPTMVHEMPNADLPTTPEALSQLDELIIASDRVCHDEAAVAAIRQWLAAGGRLWILLDQVEATTLEQLLGDRCDVAEIDRVELNSFTLSERAFNQTVSRDSGEYEQPVPFVRVDSPAADVEFRINGWPAAFWLDYGAGRVLVTTLGARGWLPPQRGQEPEAIPPAVALTGKFFGPKSRPESLPKELPPVVEGYIGYTIPSQGLIVGLLGGFAVVLFLTIAALWFARRLEWIGIVTPALAVAFGLLLILTGFRHQHAVGATVGRLQIAESVPGGEILRVRGITGLYVPEGRHVPLAGDEGGRFVPDMRGLEGMNRRLIWTDTGRWHWENLYQPGGLRLAEHTASVRLATPLAVDATFDHDGVQGRLRHGLQTPLEDSVLLTSNGRAGARMNGEGQFSTTAQDFLGPGQYLA